MTIKFNQTKSKIASNAPADARKQITESILGNIGSGSSCDPHGNPMYDYRTSSFSEPVDYLLQEEETAASGSFMTAQEEAYSEQSDFPGSEGYEEPAAHWFSDSSAVVEPGTRIEQPIVEESYVRSVREPQWFSDSASGHTKAVQELDEDPADTPRAAVMWCAPPEQWDQEQQSAQQQQQQQQESESDLEAASQPAKPEPMEEPTIWCAPPTTSAEIAAPQTEAVEECKTVSSCFVAPFVMENSEDCFRLQAPAAEIEARITEAALACEAQWFDAIRTREFEVTSMTFEPLETREDASIQPAFVMQQDICDLIAEASTVPGKTGISRTQRGTIELIIHPTGTAIKPHYNLCGILLAVHFNDGSSFIRSNGPTPWMVLDPNGNEVPELQIIALTMDRRGNVIYVTADGARMTIHADGSVSNSLAA